MLKIAVIGISCTGIHGVLPAEKVQPQQFLIDIECILNNFDMTDELSATVDYQWLVDTTQGVISGESCQLLETLAVRIAKQCLRSDRIKEITVRVHKPQGPLSRVIADSYAEVKLANK